MDFGLGITTEISIMFEADMDLTTGRCETGLLAQVRFPAGAGSVAAPTNA